jgi:rubrerythrin
VLKAVVRWLWPKDATPQPARREDPGISREQLDAALEEHMRDITYEWNEMYEKFEKLHLRLAKRADREAKKQQRTAGVAGNDEERYTEGAERVSILSHRRLGSI